MQINKPISIEKSQSIADIEMLLRRLADSGPCDVLLPKQLRRREFGGVCALIQFLITWSKRYPSQRLLTYVTEGEHPGNQLNNLLKLDHGLVAVLAASD